MDDLRRHTIFEVIKFLPHKNANDLLTTQSSWVVPLRAQIEKQRKAMHAEISHLEDSSLTLETIRLQCQERYTDLQSQMSRTCGELCHKISGHKNPSLHHTNFLSRRTQTLQTLQCDLNLAFLELCDVTTKKDAVSNSLENLRQRLVNQSEKSEPDEHAAEKFTDLSHFDCQNKYQKTIN
ncbi:hypothetical protein Ddc_00035 [Ditylenchus destructor]|nr:hypothetical protein Ddc_00035 [Ditylenchus destructor]